MNKWTEKRINWAFGTMEYYLENFLTFSELDRKLWTSHVIILIGCRLFKHHALDILDVVYHSNLSPAKQLIMIKFYLRKENNVFTRKLHL